MLPERPPVIARCSEGDWEEAAPPVLLQAGGTARILNRRVLQWSSQLGTYGMGGPGFFGLQLCGSELYLEEWLVLRVWSAGSWLLLNGRWVEAHPRYYDRQIPLFSNFGDSHDRDEVSTALVGAVLREATFEPDSSVVVLERGLATERPPCGSVASSALATRFAPQRAQVASIRHRLEVPLETSLLPPYGGTDLPRRWYEDEDQRDAWVVSQGKLYL